jgi:2-hydroxychromene-2-carboxylate isomerase
MSKTIDFYFVPVSPWTYLATPSLREVAKRHGATLRYKPVNVMALFATAGIQPVGERPEPIQRYRLLELRRWSERRGMPLNLNPAHFPTSPVLACNMIIAAAAQGHDVGDLSFAFMRACWAEERNVADEATAIEIASACGLDGAALRHAADDSDVASAFEANTAEAIGHGAWGVPSMVVDGELFWGQDRVEFVERRLAE